MLILFSIKLIKFKIISLMTFLEVDLFLNGESDHYIPNLQIREITESMCQ
jgi:hypothetical protein